MDGSDARWVAAARQGEEQAFRQLVDAHARPLFQLCVRITHDPALAEDAVQEALFRAWRGLAEFDGRAAFATWLHRIAVNAALELLRRGARHRRETSGPASGEDDTPDTLDSVLDQAPGPDSHAAAGEIGERVQQQLARLSAMERTAFVLRHYQGESLDAVAGTLGINIGQAKQAVFRAVRKLRIALEPWREQ